MTIDISNYTPGRFAYLMDEPFATELWEFISNKEQTNKMTKEWKTFTKKVNGILK